MVKTRYNSLVFSLETFVWQAKASTSSITACTSPHSCLRWTIRYSSPFRWE